MTNEVTKAEVLNEYDVKIKMRRDTSWVKHITLTGKDGVKHNMRLRWDENNGYSTHWDEPYPTANLENLSHDSEFQYILDEITEDILNISVLG